MNVDPLSEELIKWLLTKAAEKTGSAVLSNPNFIVIKEQIKSLPVAGRTVMIQMLEKALDKLQQQNRDALINRKMLEPILENIAREPDTEDNAPLFTMWQGLLESALTDTTMSYGYTDVLRQMNALDVKVLKSITEFEELKAEDANLGKPPVEAIYDYMLGEIVNDINRIKISIDNLERLGILRAFRLANHYEKWDSTTYITITEFGADFLSRCQGLSDTSQ